MVELSEGAALVCDEVSTIEFRDGLFYLTDRCGGITITRAMRPHTFFKCVRGAMALVENFEAGAGANVLPFQRH